jgi:hypothetical protein
MKDFPRNAIVCLLWLAPFAAAQNSGISKDLLDWVRIKQKVAQNLARLPDYSCIETIERAERFKSTAEFRILDKMRVEVIYAGGKELYSWPGSREVSDKDVRAGMTGLLSDGEFTSHTRTVFLNNVSETKFAGEETYRGRPALKYTYRVPFLFTGWTLTFSGQSGNAGARGAFWADRDSADLLRLEVIADEIAPNVPVADVITRIDYGRIRIGSADVLAPETSEVLVKEPSGRESRNRIEFSQCRRYNAESSITFDTDSVTAQALAAVKIEEIRLPANLLLKLQLDTAIDSKTTAEGDTITAHLLAAVEDRGQTLVPQGAFIQGRIRHLESHADPDAWFSIGLEFSEIEFGNKRAAFFGHIEQISSVPRLKWPLVSSDLPGVGTFSMEGKSFSLPAGLRMIWRTIPPR